MISVLRRYEDEPIDYMLARLKRKMKYNNAIIEMRKKDFYMKPSEERKLKRRRKKTSDGMEISK
jgi:ribosomal protein S21